MYATLPGSLLVTHLLTPRVTGCRVTPPGAPSDPGAPSGAPAAG